MKKTIIAALFAAALACALIPDRVAAYSPYYLPGGKNYLSADNFEQDSGYYNSIYNFLVKPNTTYCLSLADDYTSTHTYEVVIELFANGAQLTSDAYDETSFVRVSGEPWVAFVFTTSATANYIDIFFSDPASVFDLHTAELFQLEEGPAFTGWEEYLPGDLADVNGPYFEGNGVVISNVDDPITAPEIKAGLVAIDAVDGDVSADIVQLTDGYTGNEDTLGNYVITYSVTDNADNTTNFQITVKVVDVTDPFFGGETRFEAPYPVVLPINTIKAQITASDNYDGDVTTAITLKTDGYTANAHVLGDYEVVFTVTDTSGNATDYGVIIHVIDEANPMFSGPATWTIGYDNGLTVADIKAELAVTDDYDGDLTSAITVKSDGYSANIKRIGVYTVVFEAVDSSGNASQYTVLVNVVDGIGPVVYVDASIVRVYNSTVLTLTDFTSLLVHAGELPQAEGYEVTVRFDSYSSHATEPGVYHLALDIVDPNGELHVKTFQVMVVEAGTIHVPGPAPGDGEDAGSKPALAAWITAGAGTLAAILSNLVWFLKTKKR